MKKKEIALVMTAAMVFTSMPVCAENTKHERIYVVADASGEAVSVTGNIRLENEDKLDEIDDQSLLTGIENVGGQESFSQDGESLVWKAEGNDITYQGTGEAPLPVSVKVSVSADGEEVSGDAMKDLSGEISLEVSYEAQEDNVLLAASVIPLPEEGVSDVKVDGAYLVNEGGIQCIAGWGVPGFEVDDRIPNSFSAAFKADHADVSWMYTVCSAQPVKMVEELSDQYSDADPAMEFDEAQALLTALSAQEELPETTGKTQGIGEKVNALNQGLNDLGEGSQKLAEGAGSLSEGVTSANTGAADLAAGLNTLSENSQSLRDGISDLYDSILETANEQIAASAAAAAGTGGEAGLAGDSGEADQAGAAGEAGLAGAAGDNMAEAADGSAGTDEAAQGQAGISLGIPQLTQENWELVLTLMMAKLGQDNSESAKQQYESLSVLKEKLTGMKKISEAVNSYTGGVDQANEGAAQLAEGLGQLDSGAQQLDEGAASLSEGASDLKDAITGAEKELADKALSYLQKDGVDIPQILEQVSKGSEHASYDLCPEGMNDFTVYIIRTDL